MARWMTGVVLAMVAVLIAGCNQSRYRLHDDEVDVVTWWVEDLAHGQPRHQDELIRDNASQGLLAVAEWSRLAPLTQRPSGYPPRIIARARRWPLLQTGLRSGHLRIDDEGLLRLDASNDPELVELYEPAVRQENFDRLALDQTIIERSLLDPGTDRARRVTAAFATIRIHYAEDAGGTRWTASTDEEPADETATDDESSSSSPDTPTPSPSDQDAWLMRDR